MVMDLHFAPEAFAADLHRDLLLAAAEKHRLVTLAKAARAATRRTGRARNDPVPATAGKPARNRRYAV
jgi:hypothetical protein